MVQKTPRILLLEGIHSSAVERLQSVGFHVELEGHALAGDELIERSKGYDALGIRSKTQLTEEVLSALPSLRTIGAFCIGTNQINLEKANRDGTCVFNAPYANTRSVAELVIGEMVMLSRKLGDRSVAAHRGVWKKSALGSNEVRGKVLGIVGYGHIGSQLSILAEAMGLKVIYYDIVKKLPLGNAQPVDSFEQLLRASDFVSFHVPETPETKGMMGATQFEMMKHGSYLINASRGTVVDIPALAERLKSSHLAGAAIDVFPKEPASNKEAFTSELQELENVVLTPHIGGSTEEAQESIGKEVAESFVNFFGKGSTVGAVNFPNIDVPPVTTVPRIINVHTNTPGVLGRINSIVSEAGGNIHRQFLSTDNYIGYLIMDMDPSDVDKVASDIAQLDTSLRTSIVEP